MKQKRFKERLAMLMVASLGVSQLAMPVFATETKPEVKVGWFGQQLSESTTASALYATMYDTWFNQSEEVEYYSKLFTPDDFDAIAGTQEAFDQFVDDYEDPEMAMYIEKALQAMIYDVPEAYWMTGENSYYYLDATTVPEDQQVRFKYAISKLIGDELSEGEKAVTYGKRAEYTQILSAIKTMLDEIKDTYNVDEDSTSYDKVEAIHEYLIGKLTYNDDAAKEENKENEAYKAAHTALGVFVGESNVEAGNVVCEGYAKAFKIFCDELGVPCQLVGGQGFDKDGQNGEAHMWNYVQMEDDKWYLVDVTWDDPDEEDEEGFNFNTDYFLIGSNTDNNQHKADTNLSSLTDLGSTFAYPTLSETDYEYDEESRNADLTTFDYCIEGQEAVQVEGFETETLEYDVVLPEETAEDAKIHLGGTLAAEGAICTRTPEVLQLKDGAGRAEFKVTAADGKRSNTYAINFTIAKSNDASLKTLAYFVGGEKFEINLEKGKQEYNVEVPYYTPKDAQVDIQAIPTNNKAKTDAKPAHLVDGSAIATFTVTAADGKATKTYKINFTTAEDPRSKVNDITSFKLVGVEGKIANNVINVEVPYGTKLAGLKPTITCSDKATVTVKDGEGITADFDKPVTYVVTAENGSTKEYTVNVKVLSSIIVKQGLNNIKVYKGKDATFTFEFMPTFDGKYTIVWNSASQKDVETHLTLEANKTTSSSLTIKKATSADKGEVSIRVTRDADLTDFVEGKATFGIKSSDSGSNGTTTGGTTTGGNNTSGGGGSSTPAADKKVSETWKDLSTTKQEEVKEKFTNNMPYVLPANGLTEELVKELLGSDFTDAQVKEIVENPSKLKDLGINYTADTVALTPVEEVSFKDMNDAHWAYGNVEKLAKLGIVKGFEDSTFRPKEALAVADTFTFLNRVMLLNNDTYMNLSRETVEKYVTNKESWAFKDVATISSKLSEKTLKEISILGNKSLSRGLLAQVLFEATQGKLAQSADSINFIDTQASPYQEAIDYCVRAGLLKGTSSDKMQPEKALTRAELMTILVRLNDLMK